MDIPVNTFKHAILAGKPQIGLWSSLCSEYAAEIVAGSGFDWLLIDTEHSPNDLYMVVRQLQGAAAGKAGLPASPAHPVVRPAWNDMVLIKRYLDAGAQSLLIPYIQTADEARSAVACTRYPPGGVRGLGGTTRATRFGRVKDYFRVAAGEICVLLQIETALGLENLEAIAGVDGVAGVFIGPSDLSAGLGHIGNPGHPGVRKAIDDAIRRIIRCGKAAGILTADEKLARHYLDLGARFVAVGQDIALLARETEKLAAKFKA